MSGKTGWEPLSEAATVQNRLTGFTYDAAGNMTQNGSVAYTYDAENRLTSTAGYTYVYDADGNRVEKCNITPCPTSGTNGTLYWRGTGSDTLDETDLSGNALEEYTFFNGKRIARRDISTNTVHYYFSDHLGTHSLITDQYGTMPPQEESDYYPYGGEIPVSGSDPNHYKFTGKERDSESGLDDFGARFDASTLGRFMSADSGPYIWSDPQTLDRYTYTRNNPLEFVDPTGRYFAIPPDSQNYFVNLIVDVLQAGGDAAEKMQFVIDSPKYAKVYSGTFSNDVPASAAGLTAAVGDSEVEGSVTEIDQSRVQSTGETDLRNFLHEFYHVYDDLTASSGQEAKDRRIAADGTDPNTGSSRNGPAEKWAAAAEQGVLSSGTGELGSGEANWALKVGYRFKLQDDWNRYCKAHTKDPQCTPVKCTQPRGEKNPVQGSTQNCQ
ncbi:MAG: RHS repeat-associated core domain-containing protein [Terriglobales bacterium]